jgi:alkylation response protein AidB-like acyl-CoA dehydrogenase
LDFEFSEDQELLRATVQRFLAERAPISYVRSMLDDDRGTTDDVWSALTALGVVGLLVPETYGGAGMGMVDVAVVLEELGRAVHPGPFASSAVGAVSLVVLAGSEDDHADFLPALASGKTIGTVALSAAGRVRAASSEGSDWTLAGEARHVPDAGGADTIVVTATETDGGELGAFVVTSDAPGCSIEPTPTVDGTCKFATVTLADTRARRLGAGDATSAVAETVDRLGIAAVVDGVGAAERALEMAVEYAKERRQFDRPVGSFQAVQHLCADMLRAVELARAGAYYACWAADAADPAERHRAATMAQAFAADELYTVGASLIQVHGGIGFTWEHDAHLFYKRLLTLKERAGGSSGQLEELASLILDLGEASTPG